METNLFIEIQRKFWFEGAFKLKKNRKKTLINGQYGNMAVVANIIAVLIMFMPLFPMAADMKLKC
jgi:hypothetical protein